MGKGIERPNIKLKLDLTAFSETPFVSVLDRCAREGICFETLHSLGDTAHNRRKLYALNKVCSRDIPGRGAFYSYEEYSRVRFERLCYDPRGVVLALHQNLWVGLAASADWSDKGFIFNDMTGVLRSYRGRGIATAMKLQGIRYAISRGVDTIYTVHDAENESAIQMNRRLGFVDTDWESLV